jgi:hypothetical protein
MVSTVGCLDPAGPSSLAAGLSKAVVWVVRRVTSAASPLSPSSMASTASGIAAAIPWATRSGWAWATFPPIDAAVPQTTSSQP